MEPTACFSHDLPSTLASNRRAMSLTNLPTELLTAIVAHLGPSQSDFDNFDGYYMPDTRLYHLVQTCKALRDVCIPELYKICNLRTDTRFSRRRSLFRTLAARPELAQLVKRVIVDTSFGLQQHRFCYNNGHDGPIISAEDAETWNGIMEAKLDMSTVAPFRERQFSVLDDGNERGTLGHSLGCLALALVPNITSAILITENASLGNFKPGSFPLLEKFSLKQEDTKFGGECESAHGVLRAAPNIETFVGHCVSELPRTSYPSVKKVSLLYSRIDNDEAAFLPVAFPNLESFSYMHNGIPDRQSALPRVLSDFILRLGNTLKHLEIEAGPYDEYGEWLEIGSDENYTITSLASMPLLQSLRINGLYIYRQDRPALITLVDFLPASIQSLHIDELETAQLQDLLALAHSAPQQFPRLTQVAFSNYEPSLQDSVRQAFAQQGIACSFEMTHVDNYGDDTGCSWWD